LEKGFADEPSVPGIVIDQEDGALHAGIFVVMKLIVKGNLRFWHSCSPLLLVTLPYPETKRMFSETCNEAKKYHERGSEAVLDDSDCGHQSEIL